MSVYKSGAFLQQCFSVHPLSLTLKHVAAPEVLGVVCTNCRMRHRLTLHPMTAESTEKTEKDDNDLLLLQACFHAHPKDIRISLVHVERQAVEFRCWPCRRTYAVDVALFETHQS